AAGLIRYWNAAATRIFGFAEGEAVGARLDLIIPERLRSRHWEGYNEVMGSGQSRYGSGALLAVPALHKDGAVAEVVEIGWRNLRVDQRLTSGVGAPTEITCLDGPRDARSF
ncbi:MAG: PAS domain S-box protein, partial [Acetobacteraceae bacterium]|nr:PAS domain S-box protein [Acetobacteraceae bacterium]